MSKNKTTVIGIDEVSHKRIQKVIQKVKKPIMQHLQGKDLLPSFKQERDSVSAYISELLKDESMNDDIKRYFGSQLAYFNNEYNESLEEMERQLNSNEDNITRANEFLSYLEQYIKYDEKNNTYTYTNVEELTMLLLVIDTFDLDDKHKENKAQLIAKQEQTKQN